MLALCFVHGPWSYNREKVCRRDGSAEAKIPLNTHANHSFTNSQLHPNSECSKAKSASEAKSLALLKYVNIPLPQSKIRLIL